MKDPLFSTARKIDEYLAINIIDILIKINKRDAFSGDKISTTKM